MSSQVAIAKRALIKLGAGTITSLTDDGPKAVALNESFAPVRDAELRRRRWKFSIARASLPALSATPAFGYSYAYQVPDGFLRLLQVGDYDLGAPLNDEFAAAPTALYSLEGRQILTNLTAPLKVRYIQQVADVSQWDAAFQEAIASRLAYECCYRITQSTEREDRCLRDYKMALQEAVRANALESAAERASDDTWLRVRAGR